MDDLLTFNRAAFVVTSDIRRNNIPVSNMSHFPRSTIALWHHHLYHLQVISSVRLINRLNILLASKV